MVYPDLRRFYFNYAKPLPVCRQAANKGKDVHQPRGKEAYLVK